MKDSAEVDKALVNRLSGDATLMGLCPDGVWFDQAEQGKRQFVLCSIVFANDLGQMAAAGQRRGIEEITYEVTAMIFGSNGTTARQAAFRIDELLEDQPLTVPGFHCGAIYRIERLRMVVVDEADPTIRWQHRGGQYRVQVTPV